MSATTTTITTTTDDNTTSTSLIVSTLLKKNRESYEEEEREALEALRATGQRLAAAMKASGEAYKALEAAREEELQARLDQPKKQRAYLLAKVRNRYPKRTKVAPSFPCRE
jgi:hypothetical protein